MTAYPELVNCRLALNSDGIPEALTVPPSVATLLARSQQAIDGDRRRSSFKLESQVGEELSNRQRMMVSQQTGEQESKSGILSSGVMENQRTSSTSTSQSLRTEDPKEPLVSSFNTLNVDDKTSNYTTEQKLNLDQLKKITNLDMESCISLMTSSNWDLNDALNTHFSKI